jgi:hypothetical protein
VDRAIIEKIFRVRRRRAIQLMHRFGGFQAGKAFLLERDRLLQQLHELAGTPDVGQEMRRRQRLSSALDDASRNWEARAIPIRITSGTRDRLVADLPCGILLTAGWLIIEFTVVEDLLSKLYELAQAAANDFGGFSAAAERQDPDRTCW